MHMHCMYSTVCESARTSFSRSIRSQKDIHRRGGISTKCLLVMYSREYSPRTPDAGATLWKIWPR